MAGKKLHDLAQITEPTKTGQVLSRLWRSSLNYSETNALDSLRAVDASNIPGVPVFLIYPEPPRGTLSRVGRNVLMMRAHIMKKEALPELLKVFHFKDSETESAALEELEAAYAEDRAAWKKKLVGVMKDTPSLNEYVDALALYEDKGLEQFFQELYQKSGSDISFAAFVSRERNSFRAVSPIDPKIRDAILAKAPKEAATQGKALFELIDRQYRNPDQGPVDGAASEQLALAAAKRDAATSSRQFWDVVDLVVKPLSPELKTEAMQALGIATSPAGSLRYIKAAPVAEKQLPTQEQLDAFKTFVAEKLGTRVWSSPIVVNRQVEKAGPGGAVTKAWNEATEASRKVKELEPDKELSV